MSRSTPTEGYPVMVPADLAAAPPQLWQLAYQLDVKFPTWDAGFSAITRSHAFRYRLGADMPAASAGVGFVLWDTVDFDNAPSGQAQLSGSVWAQLAGEGSSWWFFAAELIVTDSATPTADRVMQLLISVNDVDPATNLSVTTAIPGEAIVTGSTLGAGTGDYIRAYGIALCHGSASANVQWGHNDTVNKVPKAGSWWGGFRMGAA